MQMLREIIYEQDVARMLSLCESKSEKLLLSLIWHTGALPAELVKIRRADVEWGQTRLGTSYLTIRLPAKPRAAMPVRELRTTRPLGHDSNIYIEQIISWSKSLKSEEFLLQPCHWSSTRSVNRVMARIAGRIGKPWLAAHWRDSVLFHLARSGLSVAELKTWAGHRTARAINRFMPAVPLFISIENIKKSRQEP